LEHQEGERATSGVEVQATLMADDLSVMNRGVTLATRWDISGKCVPTKSKQKFFIVLSMAVVSKVLNREYILQ
jgi:hypothetical protein